MRFGSRYDIEKFFEQQGALALRRSQYIVCDCSSLHGERIQVRVDRCNCPGGRVDEEACSEPSRVECHESLSHAAMPFHGVCCKKNPGPCVHIALAGDGARALDCDFADRLVDHVGRALGEDSVALRHAVNDTGRKWLGIV